MITITSAFFYRVQEMAEAQRDLTPEQAARQLQALSATHYKEAGQ